ncbi:MAG: hypothetical protein H0U74_21785 [Bradymonadaceae bacterium]|nr:hypothetical protein [Lujinxingiaceae bacterium]
MSEYFAVRGLARWVVVIALALSFQLIGQQAVASQGEALLGVPTLDCRLCASAGVFQLNVPSDPQYQDAPDASSSPFTRVALETGAGLGVWAGAISVGGLMLLAARHFSPGRPDDRHPSAGFYLFLLGAGTLFVATLVIVPMVVENVGNRYGRFGDMLISGLVGLGALIVVSNLYGTLGAVTTLILIPFVHVLGTAVTFELTHSPPATWNASSTTFNPGLSLGFHF